jgi:uncharacterized protein YbbC (DUF1343 family)
LVGAPWIDAKKLSSYLESRGIAGVRFEPVEFTPSADRYARQDCRGVRIKLTDRDALASPMLGVELISALHRLYPDQFQLEPTLGMLGSRRALEQISAGQDPRSIASAWQPALQDFLALRSKYLLY